MLQDMRLYWAMVAGPNAVLSLSLSAPLSVSLSVPLSLSATAILVAVFLFASFHSKYKVSGFVELSKEGEGEGERD